MITSSPSSVPQPYSPVVAPADASPFEAPEGEKKAFDELVGLAHRRTGAMPVELATRHVLDVTAGADWPVQRAAMEALLRRLRASERDELKVCKRPEDRRVLGSYSTRRPREQPRPYRTTLHALAPPRGSCDCPDFLKNSLGLCKHLLTVMQEVWSDQRRVHAALAQQDGAVVDGPWLTWDPVRPMTGSGDWLARVRLHSVVTKGTIAAKKLRPWFVGDGDSLVVRDSHVEDPRRRLALVDALLGWASEPRDRTRHKRVDPALRALLEREKATLELAARCRAVLSALPRVLGKLHRPLYSYQLEGVRRFLSRGRLLLADDMGLGKTAQAIACCHALWHTGQARRGLLIVPAALKPQWQREWQSFTDVPVTLVDGGPAERSELYKKTREGFLVCNYEQVLRDLPLIQRFAPELVVLDEAQRIKNWATKTATYVQQLTPPFRLVLTGTPMENRLDEIASILGWVDDGALAPIWRLGPAHAVVVDGTREVSGARHLETLRQRLAPHMLRRVRREVLTQLPPRTDTRVSVELTPEQADEHDALDRPIQQLMSLAQKRPLTPPQFLKLMQLLTMQRIYCNGLALARFVETWPTLEQQPAPSETMLRSLCSPKLVELRSIVENLVVAQQRKVVIFSQWRRMLQLAQWAVSDVLARAGARAVFFSGQEGRARRVHNLVDFHDDPRTAVLLCTDAGGVGLNLQRAASCCINLELPWNPAVLEQRIGRIYRLGQELPIEVYNLVSESGLEAHIADLVSSKHALFKGLFDGESDEIAFDRSGSFLKQLEKLVRPVELPAVDVDEAEAELDHAALDDDVLLQDVAGDEAAPNPEPLGTTIEAAASSPERMVQDVGRVPGSSLAGAGHTARDEPDVVDAVESARLLGQLFSQVRVTSADSGRVVIEAPAEVAAALSSVLAGVSKMLSGFAGRHQDALSMEVRAEPSASGGVSPHEPDRPPPPSASTPSQP